MLKIKFLYVAALVMVGEIAATKLPDYIKTCKRDQNSINDCVKNRIKDMRPYLPKGIPEINLPSLDPFTFKELKPAKSELDDLKITFNDVQVVGLSDFEVKNLNVDLENKVIKISLKMPVIRANGNYYLDLQILAIPIKGKGPFSANFTDINVNGELKYKLETRDGKDHMKFTSCKLAINVDDYHIRLEGLLEDALGEAGNRIVNENKKELLRVMLPYLETAISNSIVLDAVNSVASAATYDDLLPAP